MLKLTRVRLFVTDGSGNRGNFIRQFLIQNLLVQRFAAKTTRKQKDKNADRLGSPTYKVGLHFLVLSYKNK